MACMEVTAESANARTCHGPLIDDCNAAACKKASPPFPTPVVPLLIAHTRHNTCALNGGAQLREALEKSHVALCRLGLFPHHTIHT